MYGDTAKKLDKAKGSPNAGCCLDCCIFYLLSICCLQGFVGCGRRSELRQQFNLEGEDCPACCAYTCCAACAVCQDANEFRSQENEILAREAAGVQMAPVQQVMTTNQPPAPAVVQEDAASKPVAL